MKDGCEHKWYYLGVHTTRGSRFFRVVDGNGNIIIPHKFVCIKCEEFKIIKELEDSVTKLKDEKGIR